MKDERIWAWNGRFDSAWNGIGYDEYVCYETLQIKRVWDDGYKEFFKGDLTFSPPHGIM